MEIMASVKSFKCDHCGKFGVIELDKQSLQPIYDTGAWLNLEYSGNNTTEDYCSMSCLTNQLNKVQLSPEFKVTITNSLIRNKG